MNKQVQAIIDALERQGIAADIVRTKPQTEENVAKIRLRFDRVALRFVGDLQAALQDSVPDGKTLMFTITAPIRLASKTGTAVETKVRSSLARKTARIGLTETIHGNQIRVRLLRGGLKGSPKVIGFVHNPGTDPDVLFRLTQSLLGQSEGTASRRALGAKRAPTRTRIR